jgi:hypothetical protein
MAEEGWLDCTLPELKKGVYIRNTSPPATIAEDGTFTGDETFDARTDFGTGNSATIHSVVTGAFGDTAVKGTWTVTATVLDAKTHAQKGTCSAKIGWAAGL